MAKEKEVKKGLWEKAEVTIAFREKLCGSVPQSKELIGSWLRSRMPRNKPEGARPIEELEEEVAGTVSMEETDEEIIEKTTVGFQHDEETGELFVRGGTWKAHLKDCGNQVRGNVSGVRTDSKTKSQLRAMVANKIFVDEYRVKILKDGKAVTEPDGSYDQPIHILTPKGPRNALKTIKYVFRPTMVFHLRLLPGSDVTRDVVDQVFQYGSDHGYGGERGMGEGKYDYSIKWLDE